MNKITAREIQLFVAGALALIGFRGLIWLPYYFVDSGFDLMSLTRIVSSIITGLALPIGIALLMGRASAMLLAKIYLWLTVISGCVVVPLYNFVPTNGARTAWRSLPEGLTAIVLLGLILWSRSRRFNNEPAA